MSLPQIVSLASTIILTIVAGIVGVQIISLLSDLKVTLTKLNRTLDTADETMERLQEPAAGIVAVVEGFRQSGKVIETISNIIGRRPKAPVDTDE